MATFDVLSGRLALDTGPWQRALAQAQPVLARFVENMGRTLNALQGGVAGVANAMGGIAPVLARLGDAGAKLGAAFEPSLAKMRGLVQATAGDFDALGSAAAGLPSSMAAQAADAGAASPADVLAMRLGGAGGQGQAAAASTAAREAELKSASNLQRTFDDLAKAAGMGQKGLAGFHNVVVGAGKQLGQLGGDMNQLDLITRRQAAAKQGAPTPEDFQAQLQQNVQRQAAMASFAQQVQSVWPSIGQAMAGTDELNALIEQAKASGNPLAAYDLVIGNVKQKVQMAYTNLQSLMGSGMDDPFGIQQGTGNLLYLMSTPAGDFIKSLLATLDKLARQRGQLADQLARTRPVPKMAAGGVVQQPTYALVGEQGPEAVLPLGRLWDLMHRVVGAQFPASATSGWNLGQNFSQLGGWFANAQAWLNRADLTQNPQGAAYWGAALANLASIQDQALAALTSYQQHRQIDLQPVRGSHVYGNLLRSGSVAPPWMRTPGVTVGGDTSAADPFVSHLTVNIQGADLTTPAGARQVVERIIPHLSNAMKAMGRDAHGFNRLTSAPQAGPQAPTGYAR